MSSVSLSEGTLEPNNFEKILDRFRKISFQFDVRCKTFDKDLQKYQTSFSHLATEIFPNLSKISLDVLEKSLDVRVP